MYCYTLTHTLTEHCIAALTEDMPNTMATWLPMDTPYNLDAFGFDLVTPVEKDFTSQDQTEQDTACLSTKSKSNPNLLTPSPNEVKKSIKATIAGESVIPSGLLIKERIGKEGLMWPQTYSRNHTAAPLL